MSRGTHLIRAISIVCTFALLACASTGNIKPTTSGKAVTVGSATAGGRMASGGAASGPLAGHLQRVAGLALGNLSPNLAQLMQLLSPLAMLAVQQIAQAIEQAVARRHERNELHRVQMAAARSLYAEACVPKGAAASVSTTANDDGASKLKQENAQLFTPDDIVRVSESTARTLSTAVKTLGSDKPATLRLMNQMAITLVMRGDLSHAMGMVTEALKAREKLAKATDPPPENPVNAWLDVAESLNAQGLILRATGLYQDALAPLERALKLREEKLGANHVCVAESKTQLGVLHQLRGEYDEARRLLEEALDIRTRALRPGHPEDYRGVAQALNEIGQYYLMAGNPARAEQLLTRARDSLRELGFTDDDPDVLESGIALARLYHMTGRYSEAEKLYKEIEAAYERRAANSLEVADVKSALAELYLSMGEYVDAKRNHQAALDIRVDKYSTSDEKKKGQRPAHPAILDSLTALADVEMALHEWKGAEKNYAEALALRRQKLGKRHPAVAQSLDALATLYKQQGDFKRAESNYRSALSIRSKALGQRHPSTAESLFRLGALYHQMSNLKKAEVFYRQALDIRRAVLRSNPDLVESENALGSLLVSTGRSAEGIAHFTAGFTISENLLRNVGIGSSEARLADFLRHQRAQENIVYSLLVDKGVTAEARALAMRIALLRKGRSVDETAATSRAVYQGLGPKEQRQADDLKLIRQRIAELELAPRTDGTDALLHALGKQKEDLDQSLRSSSAALRAQSVLPGADEILRQVASALPQNGALIEVIELQPISFQLGRQKEPSGASRYYALVLLANGELHGADLGAAAIIDSAIARFFQKIIQPMSVGTAARAAAIAAAEPQAQQAAQELDRLVMAPLRGFLGGRTELFLSLDGQLNLMPFAALHDGTQYLLSRYELTYLTSGRDLLRTRSSVSPSHDVTVLARPQFVAGATQLAPAGSASRGLTAVHDASLLSDLIFPGIDPLKATEEEARSIVRRLPEARLLLGVASTKEALLSLKAPGILHIATHGYFNTTGRQGTSGTRGMTLVASPVPDAAPRLASPEDALTQSMLLLAGVGAPTGHGTEVRLRPSGIATALEVAGMNLWGTQLVVLSACETGRGDVQDLGQGVYGLRRAVLVAGAETLVTSLWAVDDEATRDLMTRYYDLLLAGKGRVAAMREAALAVQTKRPFIGYWAPFIAIGQQGPLVGISAQEPPRHKVSKRGGKS